MTTTATVTFNSNKFVRLRQRLADLRLLARSLSEELRETVNERQKLDGLIHTQETRRAPAIVYRQGDRGIERTHLLAGAVPATVADRDRYRVEESDLRRRQAVLEEERGPLAALVHTLSEFLQAHGVDPAAVVADGATAPPPRVGSVPSVAELGAVREQIATAKRERAEVVSAPLPEAEALAKLDDELDRLAGQALEATTGVRGLVRDQPARLALFSTDVGPATTPDALRTIARLLVFVGRAPLRAALAEAVRAEIAACGGPGLPAAQRTQQLAALDDQVLELELSEEQLVEQLEASGAGVARRPDADPRAVLGWPADAGTVR
jgi:hypothetical protein